MSNKPRLRRRFDPPLTAAHLDCPTDIAACRRIAAMSDCAVRLCSQSELIDIVETTRRWLPHEEWDDHLHDFDVEQLRRLAFLARRCCQHMNSGQPDSQSTQPLNLDKRPVGDARGEQSSLKS